MKNNEDGREMKNLDNIEKVKAMPDPVGADASGDKDRDISGIAGKDESAADESAANCGCCCKKTVRSEEERRKLINRLNRIEGQIRGIRGMLERDAYCNDILIQSAAVNAAVNSFNKELLASHIHSCVVRDIREGKDEVVDELVDTIQKLMR